MNYKRLALVGCGRISNRHIEAVAANEGVQFKTVCDIIEERAKLLAEKAGCNYVTNIRDIPEVDIIIIATPSGSHPKHVMEVAEHCKTKYISCEKPVSLTVREAVEMYRYLEKKKIGFLPIYQNRYNPLIQFIKNLIDNGDLGKIFQFNSNVFWNRNDDYFVNNWHGSIDLDGGVLYTQASHYIDMLHFFFGRSIENKGHGGNQRNLEVHDSVSAVLKFENGTVGSINATISTYRQNYLTGLTIIGEKGTITLSGTNLNTIDFWDVEGMEKPDMDFKLDHQYGKGHDTMYEYIVKEEWGQFPTYEDVIAGINLMEKLSF